MSHHPPAAAHHVISERGWTLRQEITVASKFRGKYLSIMPLGKSNRSSYMFWDRLCTVITQVTSAVCPSLISLCSLLSFLLGTIHAIFEKSNNHYTWKKVTTTVHNIIVGKLWIDQVKDTLWRLQLNLLPPVFTSISFFFCLSPVGGDRRGESHYWRPLPPEVCTLQLLLQRRGQEGEEPIVLTFPS